MKKYHHVLTIAGSDSGGGAGIQADLKTFSALGCFGMSVITAVTAQNTCEVTAIHPIPNEVVSSQMDAVVSDIGVDAVKIGMLSNPEIIATVEKHLPDCPNIVLDPVMVTANGDKLLQDDAIDALRTKLLPRAKIITPNQIEAELLLERTINTRDELLQATHDLLAYGPQAVLIKGSRLSKEESPDCLLIKDQEPVWLEATRVDTNNTHGTGCTLSSAIASFLARGESLQDAVKMAKDYISKAILAGKDYQVGQGRGPVKHFYANWLG